VAKRNKTLLMRESNPDGLVRSVATILADLLRLVVVVVVVVVVVTIETTRAFNNFTTYQKTYERIHN